MQKSIFYLALFIIISSCSEKINESDLENLNGYWEIQKVELSNNIIKEYKINEEIEQIDFHNDKGIRRKIVMLFDGNFISNNIVQRFTIDKKNNAFFVINETDFSKWEEEIIELTNEKLVVKNKDEMTYYYKKRNDIKLETNGKKK